MSEHVMACIDASGYAMAVCDYAAWASQRLEAPLTFLHVLDNHLPPDEGNLSGNIGLGSREHLLEELATLYLKEGEDFAAMNAVWDAWVPQGHAPARTCVTAPMPAAELKVEITVTAVVKER